MQEKTKRQATRKDSKTASQERKDLKARKKRVKRRQDNTQRQARKHYKAGKKRLKGRLRTVKAG